MGYDPQYYNPLYGDNPYRQMTPQMMQQRRPMQPQFVGDQLIKVSGEASIMALANNMGPNSRLAAFDANEDVLYIITTDGAAYPSWQTFDFFLRDNAPLPAPDYATQEDLNSLRTEMKEAFELVQQLIQSGKPRSTAVPATTAKTEL